MPHYEFTPDHYHTTIGSHEPVLTISDGDTVATTTVDAAGRDASGEQVTQGGNPQTGPFYINDARPGDTLAVTFDYLMPNRDWGHTAGRIAPNVLEPGYVPEFEDDLQTLIWQIDFDSQTASPKDAAGLLASLQLPLNPHSGCFGVAPPGGQAISTATSSTHGGNMDFNGFTKGVTVYFPVAAEGALFHVGDGHALQGDGEIVGTGIEIPFDVTFTVRLLKGKAIQWPRADSDTHIMTVGNARPLDQCVEHASTEMIRFLEEDYGLTTREAHVLMGEAVEYAMGNMFDPAYTMVCKMSKQVLNGMGAVRKET